MEKTMNSVRIIPLLALVSLIMVTPLSAGDWPQFLGPEGNGTSSEVGLLKSWPESGPKRVWDFKCGTGYSAPSIINGKLILHHRVGDHEVVQCFTPDKGEKLWEYKYPSSFTDPFGYNNGPRCSPLLTDKYCITFGAEGVLLCLNIETGKKIWQVNTQEKWEVPQAFFGVGSTPILMENKLFVMVGGQPNSGMVAFDVHKGTVLWENVGKENWQGQPLIGWPGKRKYDWKGYEKSASYSTPVIAQVHGKPVLIALMRQGLVGINPTDGKIHFSYWFRSRVQESVNAINPVVIDNKVFVSSCYYRQGSLLLDINNQIQPEKEVWRSLNLEIHFTTPIVHDGFIYAFSGRNPPDASFRCVKWIDGEIMWEENHALRSRLDYSSKLGRGSAIMAENHLYVLGETGILALYKVNSEKPEKVAGFKVDGMDYPSWTAPILSNRRLYLRSENHLICLDVSAPQ